MRFFAFLAGAAVLATPAGAAEIIATSTIDAVTVFPDAASITRVAKATLAPGEHSLVLADLPAGVIADSVRIEASGAMALEIGSVDIRIVDPPRIDPTARAEVEVKLQALADERAGLDDRIAAADSRRKLIERLGQVNTEGLLKGLVEGKSGAAEFRDTWTAFGDGVDDALAQIRKARIRQRGIDEETVKLRATLERDPAVARRHGEARVALVAGGAGEARFNVSYRIAAAGWRPVYDARLSTGSANDKPSIGLATRAMVRQSTGEDWTGIDLTLSTARPSRGTMAPDLKPLVGQLWQVPVAMGGLAAPASAPAAVKALRKASERAEPAMEDADGGARQDAMAPAPPPKPAVEATAQLEVSGTTVNYHVPGRVSVETGKGERNLKVTETQIEPQLGARAVPKLDPAAYLTASFKLAGEAALLPGAVLIYRDGVYVGTGALPYVAPGDDIKLGFGEDDRIKVARVPVKQTDAETGTFTTYRTERREFKITVKNLRDRPVTVAVEDQIPVSETPEVVVEKLATTTPPTRTNIDDKRGVLGWSFDLKPTEEKEIRLGWRSRWPLDRPIQWVTSER